MLIAQIHAVTYQIMGWITQSKWISYNKVITEVDNKL